MPKISALMPVYNSNLAYLKETIESVLNQTFSDFEFLILNDSPQNLELENFILQFAKKDERIKYFKNPRNLGISGSRNKLIDLAKGEFLAVIDHDDISVKERFEKQVAFLEANEEVGIVGDGIELMSSKKGEFLPTKSVAIKLRLMHKYAFLHPTTMMRKSILQENQISYNALYSPCEDYKLHCDLIDKTEFANLSEIMLYYRNYDNTSEQNSAKMDKITEAIIDENKTKYPQLFKLAEYTRMTRETKIDILGLPLFKLTHIYPHTKLYFLGIPLFKITYKTIQNRFVFSVFNQLRLLKIQTYFKDTQ